MKIVGNLIGRWIDRRSRKAQNAQQPPAGQRLQELDARALRQASGGQAASTQTPNKGW